MDEYQSLSNMKMLTDLAFFVIKHLTILEKKDGPFIWMNFKMFMFSSSF